MQAISDDERNVNDVLGRHHSRNRPNKPPKTSRLAVSAQRQKPGIDQQTPTSTATSEKDDDTIPDTDDKNKSDSNSRKKKRAPRNSKGGPKKNPELTLAYYPGPWRLVLERTILSFQHFIATVSFFPSWSEHKGDVAHMITQEIQYALDRNHVLNNGKLAIQSQWM